MAHSSQRSGTGKARCAGTFERQAQARGYASVAGVDEVGRGSLFGPVFAGAVILCPERPIRGLRDSKQLPAARREVLAERIRERAVSWAVASADAFEIDRINIYQASRLAMKRAVERLNPRPDYLLIDALKLDLDIPQEPLIGGDARSQCIAAASIVAKVHRDECLRRWHEIYPQYGLASNKGYSAPEHFAGLRDFGPTPLHRFSFLPVRQASPVELWTGYETSCVQEELFSEEELYAEAGAAG